MSERGPTRHPRHPRQTHQDDQRIVPPPDERAPLATRPAAPTTALDVVNGRRRSVRTLFAALAVYWLALLAVQLWPVAVQWWAIRRQEHGTLSFTFGGELSQAAAWIAIPPLVMTLVWLMWTRGRGGGKRELH